MKQKIKRFLKEITPPLILKSLKTNSKFGWSGDFSNWNEAKEKSRGYDSDIIFNKVFEATKRVISGEAKYERDSVLFNDENLNYHLLSSIAFAQGKIPELSIIDFGGALGSLYFQHKKLISNHIIWTVVEQKKFVALGKKLKTDNLNFKESVSEVNTDPKSTLLLLSSVIQYFENPYLLLEELLANKFQFIFIDRTGFNEDLSKDRLTIQNVPPEIYEASYPCWFLSEEKLLKVFEKDYRQIFTFDSFDKANIPSQYKGFLFERK